MAASSSATEIITPRLILRPWSDDDAPALYRYASDPAVGSPAGWPAHTSVDESLGIIRTVFSAPEIYAVVLRDTAEPIGCCGLADINDAEAELGYWIARPYWGRGLMTEAATALIRHAFQLLRLRSIRCSHYAENDRSRRVIEKCGFGRPYATAEADTLLGDRRTEVHYRLINPLATTM